MTADPYADWVAALDSLVACHSPSGAETEIDRYLLAAFAERGVSAHLDAAGNAVALLPGREADREVDRGTDPSQPGRPAIAVTAHKDEIGAIVKAVEPDGRVSVRPLGGSFPWVYGEGVVDLLGDRATVSGILSFGSRHVSHESPQKAQQNDAPLRWTDAWIDTKQSAEALQEAGIRPGTRAVVGKHRKRPFRLGNDYIASYTLDNKASVAILLALAERLGTGDRRPSRDIYLVASAKEEVGAIGALYFSQQQPLAALVALEICPVAPEYPVAEGPNPVLLSQDGYGIYDDALNEALVRAADRAGVSVQRAILSGFGSDGSIAMKFGHVPRAACLAFPTQNTHGYEIAHLGAIAACADLLAEFLVGAEFGDRPIP